MGRQDRRRRADCPGPAPLGILAPQQIGEPAVRRQSRRARRAAGECDEIERLIADVIDRPIRPQHHATTGRDRALAQSGDYDRKLGPPQQIDQGDGFEFLTTVGEGDQDACCCHERSGSAGLPHRLI